MCFDAEIVFGAAARGLDGYARDGVASVIGHDPFASDVARSASRTATNYRSAADNPVFADDFRALPSYLGVDENLFD